jgi:hypothetical protein
MPSQDELLQNYLTVYDQIPFQWNEAREFLVEQLRSISDAVNVRDIAYYIDDSQLSGQQFVKGVSTTQQFRDVFRKVINVGPLPNAATKTVPHGITFNDDSFITRLYGAGTRPSLKLAGGGLGIPLPFVSSAAVGNNISLEIDPTNIILTTTIDYSAFTRSYVVVEYVQES